MPTIEQLQDLICLSDSKIRMNIYVYELSQFVGHEEYVKNRAELEEWYRTFVGVREAQNENLTPPYQEKLAGIINDLRVALDAPLLYTQGEDSANEDGIIAQEVKQLSIND